MEGQRLQLNYSAVDPTPTRGAQFSRAGVRFSSPMRSSPAQRGRGGAGVHISPTPTVAQAAAARITREFEASTISSSDHKPPTRASAERLTTSRAHNDQEDELDGCGIGVNRSRKNSGAGAAGRDVDKRVELLARTNIRRRASTQRSSGGGESGGGAREERGTVSKRHAKTPSDREAEARATIDEMERAFRRNVVLQ